MAIGEIIQCMDFFIFLFLDSEAEWEGLNQDWLTLAKFRSEVMKRRPSFFVS